jgi:hypothetical protein
VNVFLDGAIFTESALPLSFPRALLAEEQPSPARLRHGHELWSLALGRLTEISGAGGGGGLTLAASFVRRAQALGKHALWLTSETKPFYPPDLHANGISLERLPLLFLPRPADASLVATRLLSSGGFDLLVWDLASWKKSPDRLPVALLARLGAMARHHRALVLILTEKEETKASLGCLVGLRLGVEAQTGDPTMLRVRVLKDKRGSVGEGKEWTWRCGVPEGLPAAAPLSARAG